MRAFGIFAGVINPGIDGNIDPDEMLRYFSWAIFAIVAVACTVFVFWQELAKNGPLILSSKNARSRAQVLAAHTLFLTILLCGYRICTEIIPSLPHWMTNTFRLRYSDRASFADIFSFFAALGMAYLERKWLYRERRMVGAEIENSQPVE